MPSLSLSLSLSRLYLSLTYSLPSLSVIKSGPGVRVERFYRDLRIGAIGGGSEEVMMDLAMNISLGKPKGAKL